MSAFIREPCLHQFRYGILRPTLLSEIAGKVSPMERGGAIGVCQSIQSVAQIVAPLISTALIGGALLLQWALLPSNVSGLGAFLVFRRVRTTADITG